MTPAQPLDVTVRVAYHRDAKTRSSAEAQTMELGKALQVALANYRPGEYPVIMGIKLKLLGIDAIRAAHNVLLEETS